MRIGRKGTLRNGGLLLPHVLPGNSAGNHRRNETLACDQSNETGSEQSEEIVRAKWAYLVSICIQFPSSQPLHEFIAPDSELMESEC